MDSTQMSLKGSQILELAQAVGPLFIAVDVDIVLHKVSQIIHGGFFDAKEGMKVVVKVAHIPLDLAVSPTMGNDGTRYVARFCKGLGGRESEGFGQIFTDAIEACFTFYKMGSTADVCVNVF